MAEMTMVQALNDALRWEMRKDERVVVLGEDVGKVGGVFRVTQGLIDEFGEERVIDTPLSENGIIGSAVGMAMNGLLPVPEIQFADSDRQRARQVPLPLRRRVPRQGGDPNARGRRYPGRPLSLAVPRGAVHPHAGPQGGLPE